MGGQGWCGLHILIGRGAAVGEVCLVWSRAEVTSHLYAPTLVPATLPPLLPRVFLLPSSILVSSVALSPGKACSMQAASAGYATGHIVP